VVDDFAPWRRFVIAKLRENRNLRIVGVASDGLEAIQKAEELQPDLILLDIRLPKVTGIVAARRIRNVAPKSKILFLSYAFDSDVALAALSEDGHGYLVKSDAGYELSAAVDAVMQGKKFVSCRLPYPPLARQLKLSGKVRLEVTVSPDGRVKGTRIVSGNPLLADAALEAIRMWRYEVGVKETAEVVEIDFKDPINKPNSGRVSVTATKNQSRS
jgi:TonB family protein